MIIALVSLSSLNSLSSEANLLKSRIEGYCSLHGSFIVTLV